MLKNKSLIAIVFLTVALLVAAPVAFLRPQTAAAQSVSPLNAGGGGGGTGTTEVITGASTDIYGTFTCSNTAYTNTGTLFYQASLVKSKTFQPASGTVRIGLAGVQSAVTGNVIVGFWYNTNGVTSFVFSGAITSDPACGNVGSLFSISGIVGGNLVQQIKMTGTDSFSGLGTITASEPK